MFSKTKRLGLLVVSVAALGLAGLVGCGDEADITPADELISIDSVGADTEEDFLCVAPSIPGWWVAHNYWCQPSGKKCGTPGSGCSCPCLRGCGIRYEDQACNP